MNIPSYKITKLKEFLSGAPKKVLILSHYNPDGDAVGSALAWAEALAANGHSPVCVMPNKFPGFLDWIPGIGALLIHSEQPEEVARAADEAEIICCCDFNSIDRLEKLTGVIERNTTAKRILIDHHLDPPRNYFDLMFSYPATSSTSYLVCRIISRVWGEEAINRDMATALYVGIVTDTGNFSFGNLTPDLFRTVALLVERGIDIPYINYKVYNSYSEERTRLLGYVIGHKMGIIENGQVAYLSLKENELRRFNFKQGDSEGFVNYPLSIGTVKISAMFLQTHRFIRVSLRSRGDVDVNLFARRYFDGGGHKNASGGKSTDSMEKTIERFKKAVAEFFRDEHIADMEFREK